MKPLSEVAPGLLVIQIPIQAVWLVQYFFFTELLDYFQPSNLRYT